MIDLEQLRPGTDWEIAINGALSQSDAVGLPDRLSAAGLVTGDTRG